MMSPFLPDLQLFLLMLCCLGGPLWGAYPMSPTPCHSAPHPGPLLFHVVNTLGPWWDGGAGQGNNRWVGVGTGVTFA